jgi:hypothetical protein
MEEDFFETRDVMNEFYDGYNSDTAKAGMGLVTVAIQFWSSQNWGDKPTVADAAKAFKMKPEDVLACIEDHPWMYVEGPMDDFSKMRIQHEGE